MRKVGTFLLFATAIGLAGLSLSREVAVGRVKGRIVMSENQLALPNARISLSQSADKDWIEFRARSNDQGEFSLYNVPTGKYDLYISSKAHHIESMKVTVTEGEVQSLDLTAKPDDPHLDFDITQHTYLPEENAKVLLSGFVSQPKNLHAEIYRLTPEGITSAGSIETLLYGLPGRGEAKSAFQPEKVGRKVADLPLSVDKVDAEGTFIQRFDIPKQPEGLYWVKFLSKEVSRASYFFVSKIGVVTKSDPQGLRVFCADLKTGQPVAEAKVIAAGMQGSTGPDGLAKLDVKGVSGRQMVRVSKGDSLVFSTFTPQTDRPESRMVLYSERPIYRPGDTVFYKGICRRQSGNDFVPALVGETGKIRVENNDGDVLHEQTVTVSSKGSYDFSFKTDPLQKPDYYNVSAQFGKERVDGGFQIASYRKPEFTATVTPKDKVIHLGEPVRFKVKSEYYFGGPVPGAKVHVVLTRNPDYSYVWSDEYAGEVDPEMQEDDQAEKGGDVVSEADVTLNADGEAEVSMSSEPVVDPKEKKKAPSLTDWTYSISAYVSESDSRGVEANSSLRAVRGDISLQVDQDKYFCAPGETIKVKVSSVDSADSKTPKPVTTNLKVETATIDWTSRSGSRTPIATVEKTFDPKGECSFDLVIPKNLDGELVYKVIATDAKGNEVTEERSVTVWSGAERFGARDQEESSATLKLLLDKKNYKVGESATALIRYPVEGAQVWLTVETDKILYSKVVLIKNGAVSVKFPATADDFPNATVSACAIAEKRYKSSQRTWVVSHPEKLMNISVEPDHKKYEPGSPVTLAIKTTNQLGTPVSAEVSLGVVDEAIYAIATDRFSLRRAIYPFRSSSVSTEYSFPEVYLDNGGKGDKNIKIRSKFVDTAFWNASVQTDEKGVANVKFDLPDNLTSWRGTVHGLSDTGVVGDSKINFRAAKPLMARIVGPQFMASKDVGEYKLALHNDSEKDQTVQYDLKLEGLKVDEKLAGSESIEAGGVKYVKFTTKPTQVGEAKVTARAYTSDGLSDGVEQKIAIVPSGYQQVQATSGSTENSATWTFEKSESAEFDSARPALVVSVQPSLLTGWLDSVENLVDYPYGCTEQTIGKMLPAALAVDVLKEGGAENPALNAKMADVLKRGFLRLNQLQHSSGAFGWWEYDEDSIFMTAYALDGLNQIQKLGYPVKSVRMDDLLASAEAMLKESKESKNSWAESDRLYLARVLAESGVTTTVDKYLFSISKRDNYDAGDWANLAMACHALGTSRNSVRDKAMEVLFKKATSQGQAMVWQSGMFRHWGEESTALALLAMQRIVPGDPRIEASLSVAMQRRKGYMWSGTRDTALMLRVLAQGIKGTNELSNSGTIDVELNGKVVKSIPLDSLSSRGKIPPINIDSKDLAANNTVKIYRNGGGKVYYSANFTQFVPQPTAGNALTIERTYHRMVAKKNEDGTSTLIAEETPLSQVKVGENIFCRLRVSSKTPQSYLAIEDAIPSNCEVTYDESARGSYSDWWGWSTTVTDNKVAIFLDGLTEPRNIEYSLRVQSVGQLEVPGASVYQMYNPSEASSSKVSVIRSDP